MTFLEGVLLLGTSGLALALFLNRRSARREWRRVAHIVEAIKSGNRPTSFILHGDAAFRSIGLGLEQLADERERLLKQISLEEFNLQTILSSMSEGVMLIDTRRQIRLVNPAFLRAFDLSAAPIGQSALQTIRNAAVDSMLRTALDTGRSDSREITLARHNTHFAASAAPIRDSQGNILGAAAIFHDITRIRQLEQIRRDFVSNVSHELRTPLSVFQGYLELLIDNEHLPAEERARTLLILQKHSRRLNLLVEDLLSLTRLESRNVEFRLAPLDLAQLLESTCRDWQLKFRDKNVALRHELPSEPLPPVLGEALRLEQVFGNLLANALQYTPSGGEVAIEAETLPENQIEIRVRDSGRGIPAADLPHIFERFYRADKARSRELGGTGLGLSIVKHIILGHGGTVRAESVYDRGTAIIIHLPAAPAASPAPAPSAGPVPSA